MVSRRYPRRLLRDVVSVGELHRVESLGLVGPMGPWRLVFEVDPEQVPKWIEQRGSGWISNWQQRRIRGLAWAPPCSASTWPCSCPCLQLGSWLDSAVRGEQTACQFTAPKVRKATYSRDPKLNSRDMLRVQASHSRKEMEQVVPEDIPNPTFTTFGNIDTRQSLGDRLSLQQADPYPSNTRRLVGTDDSLTSRLVVGVDVLVMLAHGHPKGDQQSCSVD